MEEFSNSSPERQTKRIHVALPIRVTYWDSESKPALEMACTYDISEQGARVTGLRCVNGVGEIVAIERGRSSRVRPDNVGGRTARHGRSL
jgi:hypothetical protein